MSEADTKISEVDNTAVERTENIELPAKANERDEKGRYLPGHDIPGPGRPTETEEEKEAKRIRKEAAEKIKEEYIIRLAESLPEIDPALIAKAKSGDVQAIKEVHDRVFGRAQNNIDVTTKGESLNTALVKFIGSSEDKTEIVKE